MTANDNHYRSPIGINDNSINNIQQSPPLSLMATLMHCQDHAPPFVMLLFSHPLCTVKIILPLSSSSSSLTLYALSRSFSPFHQASLLSPFGINGKGYPHASASFTFILLSPFIKGTAFCSTLPTYFFLPLSWCSFIFMSWYFYILPFGEGITPNFYLRYSNVSFGRGFVKMFATYSFVSTYSSLMFFLVTYYLRKWNLMGMCFVLECITGFLDIFIVHVLSQNIGMGSSYFTLMSSNVCLIQLTCVQHPVAAIYYASTVDRDTEDCFFLDQATRQSPK